jgi:3-oxoacyl-[acyl-carrier protein] reductase
MTQPTELQGARSTSSSTVAAPLLGKNALVTGASRGIGASVARQLAAIGADVAINYRSKLPRAQEVAAAIEALGRRSLLLQADITNPDDIASTFSQFKQSWKHLDILVLNASGGLEKDKPANYAMQLNLDAQVNLIHAALPLMSPGACIVFVTSHLAHFSETKPVYEGYEAVAESKKAGEDAIRGLMPDFAKLGIRLVVVSGDLIEGTITPKLLQRQSPGIIEQRRQDVGSLPDIDQFAAAIVDAAVNKTYPSGTTLYIGSTD